MQQMGPEESIHPPKGEEGKVEEEEEGKNCVSMLLALNLDQLI